MNETDPQDRMAADKEEALTEIEVADAAESDEATDSTPDTEGEDSDAEA